jgi:serine phosphatase RsbU (regulator of sigma subunit)
LTSPDRSLLAWGVASTPAPGERESGDQYLVEPFEGGCLVGVVDGLGHGQKAAASSLAAIEVLRSEPRAPLARLVERCHEALTGTRGVVMTLAAFNVQDGTMGWSAVGNVEGLLLRAAGSPRGREVVLRKGGVVGYVLPRLSAATVPVSAGDTLILATDGVRSEFGDDVRLGEAPQDLADRLLRTYRRGDDDSLVLVATYLGEAV